MVCAMKQQVQGYIIRAMLARLHLTVIYAQSHEHDKTLNRVELNFICPSLFLQHLPIAFEFLLQLLELQLRASAKCCGFGFCLRFDITKLCSAQIFEDYELLLSYICYGRHTRQQSS